MCTFYLYSTTAVSLTLNNIKTAHLVLGRLIFNVLLKPILHSDVCSSLSSSSTLNLDLLGLVGSKLIQSLGGLSGGGCWGRGLPFLDLAFCIGGFWRGELVGSELTEVDLLDGGVCWVPVVRLVTSPKF